MLVVATVPQIAASTARAQEGFAIDRYQPTPVGDAFFAVPGGNASGRAEVRGGLVLEYAKDPLVLRSTCDPAVPGCDPARERDQGSVVGHQFFAHAAGSLALFDRALLSLSVPVALVNSGDDPSATSTAIASPSGTSLGDMRIGARLRLVGERRDPLQLAIGSYVWLPTGDAESFTGNGSVRGMPHATVSGRMPATGTSLVYATQIGFLVRKATGDLANVRLGSELTYGFALGVLALEERIQIGPELYGSTVVANDVDPFARATTHAELLFGAKARAGAFVVGAAAGPGLTRGIGSPAARVLATFAYAPDAQPDGLRDRDGDTIWDGADACPDMPGAPDPDPKKNGCPPDRDGDGIFDQQDACPTVPGIRHDDPKKNGCPADRDDDGIFDHEDACPLVAGVRDPDPKKNGCPPDRDGDGIVDAEDACPTVAGVRHEDKRKNGCPPDRDDDGIVDVEDACPEEPGVRDPNPKKNGCPPDRDGDGIVDPKDACPLEKGPPDPDPTKNGCPTLVRVTKEEIKILQQPRFAFDKADILGESADLLRQVAQVLKEHPEILKVRIEGHTDSRGTAQHNKRLSERRAASVRKWLVEKEGIDAARLESEGFGADRPIESNTTEAGRAANRRVEFRILQRAPDASGSAPPAPPVGPGGAPAPAPPPALNPKPKE